MNPQQQAISDSCTLLSILEPYCDRVEALIDGSAIDINLVQSALATLAQDVHQVIRPMKSWSASPDLAQQAYKTLKRVRLAGLMESLNCIGSARQLCMCWRCLADDDQPATLLTETHAAEMAARHRGQA